MPGYRILAAGQEVLLEWERADQDGYAFRAVSVRPAASYLSVTVMPSLAE
ncbi:hypothetical protein AAIH25_14985 [Arthrobacter crystallopoietes]